MPAGVKREEGLGMRKGKVFVGALALLLVLGQVAVFAAGNRKAVDDYLKSYEAYVVEWEKLAKKSSVSAMDLLPLQQKALDFAQKSQAVQSDSTWTVKDSQKLLDLTNRFSKASTTVNSKLK
jgi:hypothetical protein